MIFALLAAALCGLGLYGMLAAAAPLRRLFGFNLLGAGVFLCFGVVAQQAEDPVPRALVITGLVVAFAATTLAVALLRRLAATKA